MSIMKRVGFATAACALSTSLLLPATASAAASWHGPFNTAAGCWANMSIPRLNAGANYPDIRGCERHDDGKYWYRY